MRNSDINRSNMEDQFVLSMGKFKRFYIVSGQFIIFLVAFLFIPTLLKGEPSFVLFFFIWLAILIRNTKYFLFIVYEIVIDKQRVIFKRNFLSDVEANLGSINQIKISFGNLLEIKTNETKLFGFGSFTGFSKFIEYVRKHNPELVTKGC